MNTAHSARNLALRRSLDTHKLEKEILTNQLSQSTGPVWAPWRALMHGPGCSVSVVGCRDGVRGADLIVTDMKGDGRPFVQPT